MSQTDHANELKQRNETIARQAERIEQLEAEIDRLKKLLTGKAEAKAAKKPRFTENYSFEKNKRKKKRRTRVQGR
jgi:cell shape-determining protein MreC